MHRCHFREDTVQWRRSYAFWLEKALLICEMAVHENWCHYSWVGWGKECFVVAEFVHKRSWKLPSPSFFFFLRGAFGHFVYETIRSFEILVVFFAFSSANYRDCCMVMRKWHECVSKTTRVAGKSLVPYISTVPRISRYQKYARVNLGPIRYKTAQRGTFATQNGCIV